MSSKRKSKIAKILPSFSRYIFIGGIVFIIDVVTFKLLMTAHLYRPLATTIAAVMAVISHFTLNKFFNFKNFERSTFQQLKTFLVVAVFAWLTTIIIIETGVTWLGLTPLIAKLTAIAINIPLGFLANYYFTFGLGIRAMVKRWQRIEPNR